jgi:LytS/YehU family sensor histidine kinase
MGFCLTLAVSSLRNSLIIFYASGALMGMQMFRQIGIVPVLQGLGTALILVIVALVRDRDEQTQAAASADVRSLQSRMNPHFLFNALNTLAALATIAPREIPCAAGRLRNFLRASFDQHERELVPLGEELAVVRAYLEIESLQRCNGLKIEETIDPGLSEALVPPFSLQPVENAVQHGLQSSPKAGRLRIVVVRGMGVWLDISISDDGQGVRATEIERVFFPAHPRVHALSLT